MLRRYFRQDVGESFGLVQTMNDKTLIFEAFGGLRNIFRRETKGSTSETAIETSRREDMFIQLWSQTAQ
jgi:hypothetical protein